VKPYPPSVRDAARELRGQGRSIKTIARELHLSPSTVSGWVRDVSLTEEQRERLAALTDRQRAGLLTSTTRAREARLNAQALGRLVARVDESLHRAGCMLYWAEGSKKRNAVVFTNSDDGMMRFFLRFLRECYEVTDDQVRLSVNCFLDNGKTLEEIEAWWLSGLGLPRSSLATATVNRPSSASRGVRRPLVHGTARLTVHSTRIVQSIYGAIQEYAGVQRPEWVDLGSKEVGSSSGQ
jgi:predicted transcriptional regulator